MVVSNSPAKGTPDPLLVIEGLHVGFPSKNGIVLASNDVALTVDVGEILGVVGESGSGKSVTCRSLIGMVPHPGAVLGGSVLFDGRNVLEMTGSDLRDVRARDIAMIFQDPASALNPVFTIGAQIVEVLRVNGGMGRQEAKRRAVELLDAVGITAPDKRVKNYPHEMSGGMRQRVMIAMALAGEPRLLLADEPTTALDVTIRAQVLRLLADIRRDRNMSMIIVSHDMGVIGQIADRVAVMYAGRIMEIGPVGDVFNRPRHPYTRALLNAMPRLRPGHRAELETIAGQPPELGGFDQGCPFAARCPRAREACSGVSMVLESVAAGHLTACPFMDDEDVT